MKTNYDQIYVDDADCKFYLLKWKYHRLDGPAIEYPTNFPGYSNYRAWWINGKVIGDSIGYLGNKIITNEEFLRLIKLQAFW